MTRITILKSDDYIKRNRKVSMDDYDFVIDNNCLVIDELTQKPAILYLNDAVDDTQVRKALNLSDNQKVPNALNLEQRRSNTFCDLYKLVNDTRKLYFPDHKQSDINDVYLLTNVSKGYHCDTVPSKGSLSTTISLRRDAQGGFIVIPHYRIAFAQSNRSLCMFNGRELMHGVTKITYDNKDAYRAVLVFHHSKS